MDSWAEKAAGIQEGRVKVTNGHKKTHQYLVVAAPVLL